jgi:hypothetical protein
MEFGENPKQSRCCESLFLDKKLLFLQTIEKKDRNETKPQAIE